MNIRKASAPFLLWSRKPLLGIAALIVSVTVGRADFAQDLARAAGPIDEGVPEVSIVRLNALLRTSLPAAQRREAADKLVQAFVVAKRPAGALELIAEQNLSQSPAERFWHAQALAASGRPNDALSLYEALAADTTFPMRPEAIFAAAEMLRELGRFDQAGGRLTTLLENKVWKTRAGLHLASLFLDKGDAGNAQRTLQRIDDE